MDGLEKFLAAIVAALNRTRDVRVTIQQSSPLRITLPDGTIVPGLPVLGLTYTAGSPALARLGEGQIPLVLPL